MERSYEYIGPGDLLRLVRPEAVGEVVESIADFSAWVACRPSVELDEPFTYVVDLSRCLRLAARRSEHLVCAAGQRVMAAGEIAFELATTACAGPTSEQHKSKWGQLKPS